MPIADLMSTPRGRLPFAAWALGVFGVATLLMTWPVAVHLTDGLPHDTADPLFLTWVLWWNAHAVPLTRAWWDAPALFPMRGTLALSEHILGLWPVTTPPQWLGGTPVLAYNLAFLVSFWLSGYFAFLLCREVTGRNDVSFVAGLLFAFNPYRWSQISHLQMLASFWMPLALFGAHRYLATRRAGWGALFAAGWALQAFANAYMVVYFSIAAAAWLAWFVPWRRDARPGLLLIGTWLLAATVVVPTLLEYKRVQTREGLSRKPFEIEMFSADAGGLLTPSSVSATYPHWHPWPTTEEDLFPGGVLLALGGVLIWRGLRAMREDPRRHVGAALRTASPLAFYAFGAVCCFVLALGPRPRLFGATLPFVGPYWLLMHVPGSGGLRAAARMWLPGLLFLTVTGALVLARLVPRTGRRRNAAVVVLTVAALLDGRAAPVTIAPLPPVWPMDGIPPGAAVLEVPMGRAPLDLSAMYRSTVHRHPVVNGYSGYTPRHYEVLMRAIADRDYDALLELARFAPLAVVVTTPGDESEQLVRWLERYRDPASPAVRHSFPQVFTIPPQGAAGSVPGVQVRPLAAAGAGAPEQAALACDGSLATRWQTERPQRAGDAVTLDAGRSLVLSGIALALGEFSMDYPRDLEVAVSRDGAVWASVWRGRTAPLALRGILERPTGGTISIAFAPARGRFVRLRAMADDPKYAWSIAEAGLFELR